ncbi:MAG: TnpV protein [Clostridia bacterium]|nr:TnpV protein [Clostridia bacterium]
MFIGHQQELQLLQQELTHDRCAVLVYGKRRVGKTTLIKKAIADANCKAVYFECMKGTMQENIDSFVRELLRMEVLPVALAFTGFADVFAYLNTLPQSFIIVIDEYPYLKSMSDSDAVDSLFQNIIDNKLKNIRLILSGSHIGMMKDMLREGNALYGRFHAVIRLTELNYLDASGFYPDRSAYDKVAFYSVFGGSPFINEALNANETLRENIIRTILNPNNPVYLYASQLLLSDYSIRMNAERIFAVLGNGRKRYSDIENRLDANKTGALSKQIKSLMDLEIIHRNEPINKPGDNKKYTFGINDIHDGENGLNYTLHGDYYLPDIDVTSGYSLGKYGMARMEYLKNHRPGLYTRLLLSSKLNDDLHQADVQAQHMLDTMIPQMAKEAGITEQMKVTDQLRWVGLMNTIRQQIEEIILSEIVCR